MRKRNRTHKDSPEDQKSAANWKSSPAFWGLVGGVCLGLFGALAGAFHGISAAIGLSLVGLVLGALGGAAVVFLPRLPRARRESEKAREYWKIMYGDYTSAMDHITSNKEKGPNKDG